MRQRLLLALTASAIVLGSAISAYASDRRITIYNDTGKRIVGIYASPIDQKDWKFNMLSTVGHPLYAHDSIVADIDDGTGYCRYDLLAVDAAGRQAFDYDVNVCDTGFSWHLVPGN